jgi:hypothetical protein
MDAERPMLVPHLEGQLRLGRPAANSLAGPRAPATLDRASVSAIIAPMANNLRMTNPPLVG